MIQISPESFYKHLNLRLQGQMHPQMVKIEEIRE